MLSGEQIKQNSDSQRLGSRNPYTVPPLYVHSRLEILLHVTTDAATDLPTRIDPYKPVNFHNHFIKKVNNA